MKCEKCGKIDETGEGEWIPIGDNDAKFYCATCVDEYYLKHPEKE